MAVDYFDKRLNVVFHIDYCFPKHWRTNCRQGCLVMSYALRAGHSYKRVDPDRFDTKRLFVQLIDDVRCALDPYCQDHIYVRRERIYNLA